MVELECTDAVLICTIPIDNVRPSLSLSANPLGRRGDWHNETGALWGVGNASLRVSLRALPLEKKRQPVDKFFFSHPALSSLLFFPFPLLTC